MLVMGHPQFETQDDLGIGHGIPSIPEWQLDSSISQPGSFELSCIEVGYAVSNVFLRLRNVFHRAQRIPFSTTRLHDLTCFVIHRLLLSASDTTDPQSSPITECIRYATVLYMFAIHGPTYYSHAVILNTIVTRFVAHLKQLELTPGIHDSLNVWLLSIGMVTSTGMNQYQWFMEKTRAIAVSLQVHCWNDALIRIKSILWLETPQGEYIFRPHWDVVLNDTNKPGLPDFTVCVSTNSTGAEIL